MLFIVFKNKTKKVTKCNITWNDRRNTKNFTKFMEFINDYKDVWRTIGEKLLRKMEPNNIKDIYAVIVDSWTFNARKDRALC